jgi:hypothetical protein
MDLGPKVAITLPKKIRGKLDLLKSGVSSSYLNILQVFLMKPMLRGNPICWSVFHYSLASVFHGRNGRARANANI